MKSFAVVFAIFFLAVAIRAQTLDGPRVFFDAVPFASDGLDSARLDLYVSVPYNTLSFEHEGGAYSARYTVHFRVADSAGTVVYDSTFTRSIRTKSFDMSSGATPAFEFYQRRVTLRPNRIYTTSIDVADTRSGNVTTLKREVNAVNYKTYPFAISGLLLVAKVREDSTGYVITPMLGDNVGSMQDGYFLFFETYNATPRTRFRIEATYKLPNGKQVSRQTFDKTFAAGRSQQWLRLPSMGVAKGAYTVELRVAAMNDTTKTLAASQRSVRFEGSFDGMPASEEELEDRISQMRYVATQGEMDNIRAGESFAEKRKRFAEYWLRLDPTPGTPHNEAMAEYYRRVDYANDHFRSYAVGWLTDKGKVYIIFGPPDNTTVDQFRNNGKPVETWQYYGRNRRFVFVDETGFGDFRSTPPLLGGEKYRYE